MQSHLHRSQEVEVIAQHDMLDELHQHLGIRHALEFNTSGDEVLLDGGIVLDDAVVDERQPSRSRIMGVGVGAIGLSVSGPTGVGDTDVPADVFVLTERLQIGHLALGLVHIQAAVATYHSHAGTVITTILQSLESFNQNGIGFLPAYVTNNSAHSCI